MRRLLAAALLAVATPAVAETYADAYGLGSHPPVPMTGGSLGDILHVTAALLHADGRPAEVVRKGEVIYLALSATRAMDRPSVKVRLRCSAYFTDADNSDSKGASGLCLNATVGSGPAVPLKLRLRFKGDPTDANATYGVAIEVRDEISGESVRLMPTWGWAGGEK